MFAKLLGTVSPPDPPPVSPPDPPPVSPSDPPPVSPEQIQVTQSAERFKVFKFKEDGESPPASETAIGNDDSSQSAPADSAHNADRVRHFVSSRNMLSTLYVEEDGSEKDKSVQRLLHRFASAEQSAENLDGKTPEKANLGTILGVFFPCLQNIFGVIYFVRLYWIVGEAGAMEAFAIVFSCCCVSLLTSLSISAIATNGKVHGGGTYFMISRSLGPEFGGAVGILFYLGISVSVAMYLIGSIELLMEYIAPQMSIFEDQTNNFRLWGTCLLALVSCAVFLGVKFVSRFALCVLSAVIISIFSVYIGMFMANESNSAKVCFLGDRVLNAKLLMANGTLMCTKDQSGPLYKLWCNGTACDPYFNNNKLEMRPGIPGLKGDVFSVNSFSNYGLKGHVPGAEVVGSAKRGEIIRDMDTSLVILLAIYFPSITGFEQGTSYSGDLRDAQKSIPLGTLSAVFVSSTVYCSTVLMFGATVHGSVLRDKFGLSIGRQLIMSQLAWPSPWVILVGALMSTVGAGLQALTAAPRLLQAVAKDEVFGGLFRPFAYMTRRNEPIPAIALSTLIAEIGILIAKLDYVAPIVTMFFLLCYGFVNFACALQSFLGTPHWRPRFRFYHWLSALLGVALCLTLMFLSSVLYACLALTIAGCVYKYIEYKGAEKEWGDGMRGLALSAAQMALQRLKEDQSEKGTKNWRPQLLVLAKLTSELQMTQEQLLSFSSQLKEGKGLTIVAAVLVGNYNEEYPKIKQVKASLHKAMEQNNMKGFADVVVSDTPSAGIIHEIQTAGLGGLYPNTVLVSWPTHWFDSHNRKSYETFIDTLHFATVAKKAVLVVKGTSQFPSNQERLTGTIDVWWIMHDGSLLIMLPFLLKQHKVWKQCQLRIFTVAQMRDNSVQIKKDLVNYMYNLRIPATVEVVEMEDKDISAYTIERTLMMEERAKLVQQMQLGRKESIRVLDNIINRSQPSSTVISTRPRSTSACVDTTEKEKEKEIEPEKENEAKSEKEQEPSAPTEVLVTAPVASEESHVDITPDPVQYTFTPDTPDVRMDVRTAFNTFAPIGEEGTELNISENTADRNVSDNAADRNVGENAAKRNVRENAAKRNGRENTVNRNVSENAATRTVGFTPDTEPADEETALQRQQSRIQRTNIRKMHTAVRLNQILQERSGDAELVIINLPSVPSREASQTSYMQFLEVLSEGVHRLVMVKGTGREVITIYN